VMLAPRVRQSRRSLR